MNETFARISYALRSHIDETIDKSMSFKSNLGSLSASLMIIL